MMQVLTDDGVRIAWTESGEPAGPAVLLSNSLGAQWDMWAGNLAALEARFRVLRYDSRGHGRSDSPVGDYSMDRLGRDALAVIDAAGAERAAVIGVSKGGMVGQWLGVHAPERITRLVLANTAAWMGPAEAWTARIATVRERGMSALVDEVMGRWFTPDFLAEQPGVVSGLRASFLQIDPDGYAGCCAAIRDMDQRPDIARIRAPTLVIGGLLDPATPPGKATALAGGIPEARLVLLAAAHLSNIEQSEAFDRLVLEFMEG